MSDLDEVSGVFDAIDTEVTAHDPVEEVSTEAVAEGTEGTTDTVETAQTEEVEAPSETAPVEGQVETEATATETTELSQEDSTVASDAEVENWQANLPPAPLPYQGLEPEFDPETGQIVNMDPAQYATYMRETLKAELRQETYAGTVENAALDAAEKILPSLKTNPAIRTMVENARVASIINGQQISTLDAAKQVREALGIAPAQLNAAKSEGAQNAKASITVQKNAALETGSTRVQTDDPANDLIKRINRGDDDAFADLLGQWQEQGKIA